MFIDVKTRVSAETGYHMEQQALPLSRLLTVAAREIYNMLECNKAYRETTLVVPPDSVVTLPSFIGELRGMRMHTNELPFDLKSIGQPRYVTNTLAYKYRNWRDLSESAVHTLPAQTGRLQLITPVPNGAEILIAGQTDKANKLEEVVVMDFQSKTTTELFAHIDIISCLTPRDSDIAVKDASGNEIAVLYTNFNKTRYKVVDVSQVFWTLDTNDGGSLIDVLYKLPFVTFTRDTDLLLLCEDYDNAWFHMAMHYYYKPLDGKLQDSLTEKQLAIDALNSAKGGTENGQVKKLSWGRNKFYGIFRKYRYFPGSVTNVDHNIQT